MAGRTRSIPRLGGTIPALVAAVALAGCSASSPTPVYNSPAPETQTPIIVDVSPTPTLLPSPSDTPPESAAPADSPEGSTGPTTAPTPTAAPTPTPAASETPTPAASETPTPAPTATSPAAGCTGTAEHQAFFAEAASLLGFDVYCAVLPSGWWLQAASYVLPDGGYLEVEYKNTSGVSFVLREGKWCPPDKVCVAVGPLIGTASFGGLGGDLYLNNTAYTLRVGTSANPRYLMVGSGMTQAQFTAWAAALIVVPGS
jgi:hypothetical protein